MSALDRIAQIVEQDPPEGFHSRYSVQAWKVIVAHVLKAEQQFYGEVEAHLFGPESADG